MAKKATGWSVELRGGRAVAVREPRASAQYLCESDADNKEAAQWAAAKWNREHPAGEEVGR